MTRRVALVDGATGSEVTHTELSERADRVAALLAAGGFGPGQHPRAPGAERPGAWAGIALGAMRLGGAVTGVERHGEPDEEVARQMADTGATTLLHRGRHHVGPDLRPPRASAAAGVAGHASRCCPIPVGPAACRRAWRSASPISSPSCGRPPGRTADADDACVALAPFWHVMGFLVTLGTALASGAPGGHLPRFDPRDFLDLLEGHRVSFVIVPPPVMPLLARSPRDLPALELIVSGGARLGAGYSARSPPASARRRRPGLGPDRDAVGAPCPIAPRDRAGLGRARITPNTRRRGSRPGNSGCAARR